MVLTRLYRNEELKEAVYQSYQHIRGQPIENIEIFEVIALLRRISDIAIILSQGSSNAGLRENTTYIIRSEKDLIAKLQELLFNYTMIKVQIPF